MGNICSTLHRVNILRENTTAPQILFLVESGVKLLTYGLCCILPAKLKISYVMSDGEAQSEYAVQPHQLAKTYCMYVL